MQLTDRISMLNKSSRVIGIEIVNRIERLSKVGRQQVTCVNGGFTSLLKGSIMREGIAAALPLVARLRVHVCAKNPVQKQREINHR